MIVVKIGGSIAEACPTLLDELSRRPDVILVHGFGPQTTQVANGLGIEQRFVTSPTGITSRYTDDQVLRAMHVAAERVGTQLAEGLEARGRPVDHLGPEIALFWGRAKPVLRDTTEDGRCVLVRGNRSGLVEDVQAAPVVDALRRGYLPVVSPLAMDEDGALSVDADRAAAALACELEADALVLLTDVPHVRDASGQPIHSLDPAGVQALIDEGAARGGMVRKLTAAMEAVEGGVPQVLIGSGLGKHPLSRLARGQATEVVA